MNESLSFNEDDFERIAVGDLFSAKYKGKLLHSKKNPLEESIRQFESIANVHSTDKDSVIIFFGAGLGYVVRQALLKTECKLYWFEPDPIIYKNSQLIFHNISDTEKHRIRMIRSIPDDDELYAMFKSVRNSDVCFYVHSSTVALHPDYVKFKNITESFLNRKDVNLATLTKFDRLWSHNLSRNLSLLMQARPVLTLFDAAKGERAVVAGGGPSLADSILELKLVRDKIILIASDTSVAALMYRGIDPDIIVTVDPQSLNAKYLESYRGNAIFVCDPTTCTQTLRRLNPNRIFFYKTPFPLGSLIDKSSLTLAGEIVSGGSVTTNAYDLAVKMGCSEIYLIGQDLSFTGGRAHVSGAPLEEQLALMESRVFRRETHNHRQLHALPARYIRCRDGSVQRSNDKLLLFYKWFQNRVRGDIKKGIEVRNATYAGVVFDDIPTTTLTSLKDKNPATWKAPVINERESFIQPHLLKNELRNIYTSIEESSFILKAVADVDERLIEISNPDLNAKSLNHEQRKLFKEMERLESEFKRKGDASNFLGSILQREILRITEGYGLSGSRSKEETLYENIKTSFDFHSRLFYATDIIKDHLHRAMKLLDDVS